MADEAKLHSPICSTFEALVVWCAVRCCLAEKLGPFCWPMTAASTEVLVHLIDLLSILLRCDGSAGIQEAIVDQTGSRPPNSDHDLFFFFWCQFSLGKCFGASSLSNQWAGHCWLLYKVNFSSHVTIQSRNSSLLLHRIRKNNTSKQWCFWFLGQLMSGEGNGTPLQYSCLENTMGRGAW